LSSDVTCAHDAQRIFTPPFISDFRNVSRAQATSGDIFPGCELDHDWQAQHPRRDRGAEFFPNPQDRKAACGLISTSPKFD
jgi:hypothetical protein